MIKSIAHICISTNDLDATEKFYCSDLGLTKKFDFLRDGTIVGYYLQINENNYIEVFLSDALSSEEGPLIKHFCLEVEDIEAVLKRLKAANVPLIDEQPRDGDHGKKLAFIHPKGAGGVLVELYQLP